MVGLNTDGSVLEMIYLILAIVSSAMISVVMRVSERHVKNNMSMLALNYLMCMVMSWIDTGSLRLFESAEGVLSTVVMGMISGVLFLAGFVFLQWNISKNGVVLPATFMKLGVLVPTVMAIVVFGETPRLTQVAGIIAAVCAILLIQGGGRQEAGSVAGLILLMLAGGGADGMSKIFEEMGVSSLKSQYLLCTFATAMILCTALCAAKKQRLTAVDALFGLAIGVPNYFSTKFLLWSLGAVPAVVAYPTYSVGTIVLVTLAGVILFREKLSRRKLIALGVIIAALALLNL